MRREVRAHLGQTTRHLDNQHGSGPQENTPSKMLNEIKELAEVGTKTQTIAV